VQRVIPEKPEAAVIVAPGARAAQDRLFAEVDAVLERRDAAIQAALAAGDAPAVRKLLARPLRIVVPSRPLRDRVSAALLQHCDASLAAVVVHTHWALALAVVERADAKPPGGEELFRLLVQRFAAEEPLLLESLGALEQGYGIALATARDLVDAGFAPGPAEALDEALVELDTPAAERTRALARVTARALAALEAEGRAPRGALLERACEALRADADALLPTTALWIHGFADATGIVGDWIETLQRTRAARVVLSIPPDPFDPSGTESEFSQRFAFRVAAACGETIRAEAVAAPSLALLRAPGAFAEVRAVAVRIRALLDADVAPESIGVVARALEPHRAAIGAHFARLAIPFSAPGAVASADLRARRLAATARLLARGERTPVDTWLAASLHEGALDGDLRVGLHVLGAAHLGDLARLDPGRVFAEREFLVLPVRRGAVEEERQDEDGEPTQRVRRVRSRSLDRKRLEVAHARACALVDRLAKWPAHADFGTHRALLDSLLEADLGWSRDDASLAPVLASLQALGDAVPASFALDRAEFAALVERALDADPGTAVGGAGAGIAVLSVMAARGCCFEHLFVLGLNRDVFPRTPTEDPLVPDAVRRALRTVLPELPVKGDGRAEERHLFAELLSSSPHVTLSWQHVNDEGREVARSSFVERLCLVDRALEVVTAPQALGAVAGDDSLRPAHEHAARAALHGSRAALAPIRRVALDEVRAQLRDAGSADVDALARVQLAILDELDPDLRTRAGRQRSARLGPWFGYAGAAAASEADAALYVTRIEALARCPWQAFLRKTLGLQPAPDALEALPAPSPLVVGNTVHALLQRVVERTLGERAGSTLAAALVRGPMRLPWPDASLLAEIALQEAARIAEQEGVRIAGFARALAQRALGMADVARRLDWGDPAGLEVLGAELGGEVAVSDVAGRTRRVGFRVDRADLIDGLLRLTDYKSGRPVSDKKTASTRREHLLDAVKQGRALQGVAYRAGASAHATRTQGRLLFLREDLDDDVRSFAAEAEDVDLVEAFEATARSVFAANDAGTFFPRLVLANEDKQPNACDWCEVSAACLRGESGQRARLRRWAEAASRDERNATDRALAGVFAIGREPAEAAS
jgi:hypothetical protein